MHQNVKRIVFNNEDHKVCPICKDTDEPTTLDNCSILECGHIFHQECINMCIKLKRCPLCNYDTTNDIINNLNMYVESYEFIQKYCMEISGYNYSTKREEPLLIFATKKRYSNVIRIILNSNRECTDIITKSLNMCINSGYYDGVCIYLEHIYKLDASFEIDDNIILNAINNRYISILQAIIHYNSYNLTVENTLAIIKLSDIELIDSLISNGYSYYCDEFNIYESISCYVEADNIDFVTFFDYIELIVHNVIKTNNMLILDHLIYKALDYRINENFYIWTYLLNKPGEIEIAEIAEMLMQKIPVLDYNMAFKHYAEKKNKPMYRLIKHFINAASAEASSSNSDSKNKTIITIKNKNKKIKCFY